MKKEIVLTLVILYLLIFLLGLAYIGYQLLTGKNSEEYNLLFESIVLGGFGGVLYCLRGVYLNYSVHKRWGNEWVPWYFIRPVVSLMCGGVSYFFLKAGLLVLEAKKETDATNLGFFVLAIIAGINVDKFISKIEDIAQATWGIEKSRSSNSNN